MDEKRQPYEKRTVTVIFQIAATASSSHRRGRSGALAAVPGWFALLPALLAVQAPAAEPPDLFLSPAPLVQAASLVSAPVAGNVQLVRLNPVVADQFRNAPGGVALQVALTLSNSQRRTAVIDRRRVSGPGRLVCRGHLDGAPAPANALLVCGL